MADAIRQRDGRPFAWGSADCAIFACDVVKAVSGADPATGLRGQYSDQDGALRTLYAYAGGGLEAAAAKACAELGWREIEPAAACDGDMGIVSSPDGPSLAVAWGWCWVAQGHEGLVHINGLENARLAWAVAR